MVKLHFLRIIYQLTELACSVDTKYSKVLASSQEDLRLSPENTAPKNARGKTSSAGIK